MQHAIPNQPSGNSVGTLLPESSLAAAGLGHGDYFSATDTLKAVTQLQNLTRYK